MRDRAARILAVVAALALLLLGAGAAAGHGGLTYSNPAANAALLEAPTQIELVFSEAIDPALSDVTLFDEASQPVPGLGALTLDPTGLDVTVSVPPLEPGLFTVTYRTTSAVDGHVVEGSFAFLYDPTGTRPAPNLPTEASSPSNAPLLVAMRWISLVGALLALGIVVFWLVSARPALAAGSLPPEASRAPWGWVSLAAWLAFCAMAVYLSVSAEALGVGAGHPGHGGGTIPLDFAAPFGSTPFANAMRLALAGSALGALLAAFRHFEIDEARRRGAAARDRERPLLIAVLVVVAASLAGSALAGHASSLGGPLFAGVDWLHLLSVAAWLGALPGLLMLAARSRRHPAISATAALKRHSRLALVAAPLVALTGIANSPLVLGTARELVASDYGDLLLAKALLFSTAIGLGAANFFLVRAESLRRALPLMAAELGIGALAVLVAAGLSTGQPGASRTPVLAASPAGVLQLLADAGDSRVHLAVNRPEPGPQRYQLSVAAADGTYRTDVRGVILTFTPPPGSDLDVRSVILAPGTDPWVWGTGGDYTPVLGPWTLAVQLDVSGTEPATATFHFDVTPAAEPELLPPAPDGLAVPGALAWLWGVLPRGAAGWLLPPILALVLIGTRVMARGAAWAPAAALALVAALLVTGLGVGSREAAHLADAAPPSAAARTNPTAATPASITRGAALYVANCSSCHGSDGRGAGPMAATLPGPIEDLGTAVPPLSDGALAYRIANGTITTQMPGFALTLTAADRWDLVNYLRSRWPATTP